MIAETINPLEQLEVESDQELESLFRDCRSGPYGAFFFSHSHDWPMLSVLLHDSFACVHYFPTDGEAGYHSITDGSFPASGGTLHFLQPGGHEGHSFHIDASMIVSVGTALSAAREFLTTPSRPTCIQWGEL
jgi:hypothetical protein